MKLQAYVLILTLALAAGPGAATAEAQSGQFDQTVTVYKSPTCGCCTGWVSYLMDNGFRVEVVEQYDLRGVKAQYGIRPELQSCHTAVVDGYAIEGHVPVADIRRLLTERPRITGLTAPGMPVMSPGMGSIEPKGYDVLSFQEDGRTEVFSRY